MKKLLKTLEWKFDYYIAWMLYNGKKQSQYFDYMCQKYPGKFEECIDRDANNYLK